MAIVNSNLLVYQRVVFHEIVKRGILFMAQMSIHRQAENAEPGHQGVDDGSP